jgi:hypothetical protein
MHESRAKCERPLPGGTTLTATKPPHRHPWKRSKKHANSWRQGTIRLCDFGPKLFDSCNEV